MWRVGPGDANSVVYLPQARLCVCEWIQSVYVYVRENNVPTQWDSCVNRWTGIVPQQQKLQLQHPKISNHKTAQR